jgi:uncharacterized membrane protein
MMEQNANHQFSLRNGLNTAIEHSSEVNVNSTERIISAAVGTLLLTNGVGNLFRNPISGLVKTALGSYLLFRGASGNCALYTLLGREAQQHSGSVNVRTMLVVNRPKQEVYSFWRQLENLPLFMKHLKAVQEHDNKRSHWEAMLPGNLGTVKWEAEIVEEEENRKISWRSIPGSTIENAGKVVFEEALGGQGTKLDILISYRPPAGDVGKGLAKMFNPMVEKYIRQDVCNFKDHIEQSKPLTSTVTSTQHLSADVSGDQPTERTYR